MLHPDTELRWVNAEIGYGAYATRLIPRGTITWVRCDFDQTFSPERIASLRGLHREIINKYGFVDPRGNTILCWDHGRYVNHACAPTCLSPGFDFEIAVRDIEAGEELTDDYGSLNLEKPFTCHCGAPSCRREIRPDDWSRLVDRWDHIVQSAFPRIREVPQALWELVREKDRVNAALDGKQPIPSCVVNCFAAGTAAVAR